MIQLAISLIFCLISSIAFADEQPSIVSNGDEKIIIISKGIQEALTRWESKAKILTAQHFSPEVWSLYTNEDKNSLPMATVGDFNGDSIKDIGLLVQVENSLHAVVALSQGETYTVKSVKKFSLNNPAVKVTNKINQSSHINVYLFTETYKLLKQSKKLPPRDGFQVEILDSENTTLHYAKNGSFFEYKGLIK